MPEELKETVKTLKSSAIEIRYVAENLDTPAQWIYVPDPEIPYHRILVRHNFCLGSKGYRVETQKERVKMFEHAAGLDGLGRWGKHYHYNSDVVVEFAMKFAEKLRTV